MSQFGNLIRQKRESRQMLLRHVAAALDVDTALVSKIERGEKKAKREHVLALADILTIDPDELLALWLADQLINLAADEPVAERAFTIALNALKSE